jgi:hypothetical protein
MRNVKLRVFVFLAACTLSVASFASTKVPCKSGQKAGTACVPAAQTKAKASTAKTGTTKAKTKTASNTKSKAKTAAPAKSRTKKSAAASASTQSQSELPPISAKVDCTSAQTILQGGVSQCPPAVAPSGSVLSTLPQSNPGSACFAALAASYASRRLAPQVPFLSASAAGAEELANKGVPSKMEKQELGSVIAGYGMCLDMAANWRRETYAPAVVSVLDAFWREAESVLKELAGGKRNFGDAARAIAEIDKTYKAQLGSMDKDS